MCPHGPSCIFGPLCPLGDRSHNITRADFNRFFWIAKKRTTPVTAAELTSALVSARLEAKHDTTRDILTECMKLVAIDGVPKVEA